jgi:hypothetical protein
LGVSRDLIEGEINSILAHSDMLVTRTRHHPTRGFSVLLPYRDYVSPSVAIGIYSSV